MKDAVKNTSYGEDHTLSIIMGRRARIFHHGAFTIAKKSSLLTQERVSEPELSSSNPAKLVFIFSGQGPQHLRMGFGLFARFPAFRDSIYLSDAIIVKELGLSLVKDFGLFDEQSLAQSDVWPILKVVLSITALQIALFDLWTSVLGRKPDKVMGHSVGEIAMLYGCGAVSRTTCLRIAAGRAKAMEMVDGNGGGMIALGCSSAKAAELITQVSGEKVDLEPGLWLAADNSLEAVTVAGYNHLVQKLCKLAQENGIFARVLKVSSAFHSPLMEVCKSKMYTAMSLAFQREPGKCIPECEVSAAVNRALWDSQTPFDEEYMWRNMREPVLFRTALDAVLTEPAVVVELALHPVLASSITSILDPKYSVSSMVRPRTYSPDFLATEVDTFLQACGKLFCLGYDVDFALLCAFDGPIEHESVTLPEYPLNRKSIWPPENRLTRAERIGPAVTRLGTKIMHLFTQNMPWFSYHVIDGMTLLPGASYLAMIFEKGARVLRNVTFEKMISFSPAQTVIAMADVDPDLCRWEIKSSAELNTNPDLAWDEASFNQIHSRGEFSLVGPTFAQAPTVNLHAMDHLNVQCRVEDMEARRKHYYQFGDIFCRSLSNVFISPDLDELVCDLAIPAEFEERFAPAYAIHPGMIDAMFQAVFFLAMEVDAKLGQYEHKWLPHTLGRICRFYADGHSLDFENTKILIKKTKCLPDFLACNLTLFKQDGTVVLSMDDCTFKLVASGTEELEIEETLYETFVQYGMPSVDMTFPTSLDCERNLPLYQYTDTTFSCLLKHADLIKDDSKADGVHDRVRFRKFCQKVLESFKGPRLEEFFSQEAEKLSGEGIVISTERIGKLIPELLKDSSAGVESLFVGQVFTSVYIGDIWSHEFNDLITKNFRECLLKAHKEGKTVLRVLEVGAVSEGLTSCLDPVLIEADILGMHVDSVATDVTVILKTNQRPVWNQSSKLRLNFMIFQLRNLISIALTLHIVKLCLKALSNALLDQRNSILLCRFAFFVYYFP